MTAIRWTAVFLVLPGLSACGGDELINLSCDEMQRYQLVAPGKRIETPEGLDSLNEFAEMPIPKSKDAPTRPPGTRCIELPPSVDISD